MGETPRTGTGLPDWVTTIFDNFKIDRQSKNEENWQMAINSYRGFMDESQNWKKGEAGKGGRKQDKWRSDAFPMLVKTKVIAFYSIMTDMLLQGGEIPFNLTPDEGEPPKASEEMNKKIRQQLKDGKADRELIKAIMSLGMYGGAYIRSPAIRTLPLKQWKMVNMAPQNVQGFGDEYVRPQLQVEDVDSPVIEYWSVWDVFRDMETDDIQRGQGVFFRKMLSPYELRQFKGDPFFDDETLETAVMDSAKEGDAVDETDLSPGQRDIASRNKTIRYLEAFIRVPTYKLIAFLDDHSVYKPQFKGVDFDSKVTVDDGRETEVFCCLANDNIVRLVPWMGERPVKYCPCELVLDEATGRGIADNLKSDQKLLTGIMRNIADNLAIAGSPIFAGHKNKLATGEKTEFYPGKYMDLKDGVDNVAQAIQQFIIQDVSAGLVRFQEIVKDMADSDANIPKLLEGVSGTGEKTKFETDVLQTNAGKYIGGVIKNVDEHFIEPIIGDYYNYNMSEPGKLPEMGPMTVHANGFTSFQNRFMRVRKLQQMLQLSLSSDVMMKEVKIDKHLEEIYKGLDISPETFLKTEQEKAEEHRKSIQFALTNIAENLGIPVSDLVKAAQPKEPGTQPGANIEGGGKPELVGGEESKPQAPEALGGVL